MAPPLPCLCNDIDDANILPPEVIMSMLAMLVTIHELRHESRESLGTALPELFEILPNEGARVSLRI